MKKKRGDYGITFDFQTGIRVQQVLKEIKVKSGLCTSANAHVHIPTVS